MSDSNQLKAALQRLVAGTSSDEDRKAVQTATDAGVLATGARAVALGGNAEDVILTTGDGNVVLAISGVDAAAVRAAIGSITPQRLRQVPPPPADFTGREEEQRELLAAIEQGGVTISGLRGLGGIGKTALALKLVEALKPRYPDAQFYLDLKGASTQPLTSAEALAHVVRAYYPNVKLPERETELRGLYLSVLDGQRAILLMDNAASAEQVEPLIPPSNCVLLVTSRRHFTLPGLVAKNLDTLSDDDARELLLTIAPRISTSADEIAALCGYLPLALRLAASALANYTNLKPANYVRRLQDQQQRLKLIDASLSLSYELLAEELRERWRWLAVFPDSFADDAAAAVWAVEADQAQQTLGDLIAASMVEWNETTGRYWLHDLARVFADAKLSAGERFVIFKRHATHYAGALSLIGELYQQGGAALARGLAMFDLEWGNIQIGHTWVAEQGLDVDRDIMVLRMGYPIVGARVLHLRQHPGERIRWLEISLAAARQLKDRTREGYALANLGLAYGNLGDTRRAIKFHEEDLAIAREIRDRKGEGITLVNLASAYYTLGETKRAVSLYEQSLSIARETGSRQTEANALIGLGLGYRALEDSKRAIESYEQALPIYREIGDRRGEGNALGNIGVAYKSLGETQRGIHFYEQQLAIVREIGDRRGEGSALGNLGIAYKSLGETHRAIQLYEEQLAIVREIGDRRSETTCLWNLSLALDKIGERAKAIQHAEQLLNIREQIGDSRVEQVRAQIAEWREESLP